MFSYLPTPDKLDVCGLLLALSVTFNVPVRVPVAVGVNTTLIVQLAFAARLVVHVVAETLKSPVVVTAILLSATVCLFDRVNTFAALVVPTVCAAYALLAGPSVTGTIPVPDKGTVCGLFDALSVSVNVPVRAPNAVGVKVTLILHDAPAAKVLPHGFGLVVCPKSPLIAMLLMFSVAVPVLVTVNSFPAAVCPTTTLPKANDVGARVTIGPPPLAFTVSCNVVVCVRLPDTPVMVTVEVPVAAVALAVKVRVLVEEVGLGLIVFVMPLGRVEVLRVTLPLKPFSG